MNGSGVRRMALESGARFFPFLHRQSDLLFRPFLSDSFSTPSPARVCLLESPSDTGSRLRLKRCYTDVVPLHRKLPGTPLSKDFQILALCRSGFLFEAIKVLNSLDPQSPKVDKPLLYASLLQTSTKVRSFSHGLQVHSHVVKSGIEADRLVGNSLLSLYFKLDPDFNSASKVFLGLAVKDVISWTTMMTGYNRAGKPRKSIGLFLDMLDFGIKPNAFTLSAAIKGCSELGDVKLGGCFHGLVFCSGLQGNCFIASTLIDMYGKNGNVAVAHQIFGELLEPDSVCWTSMISVLTSNDLFNDALGVFCLMQKKPGLLVDEFTYGSVLTACGNIGLLKQGKQMHAKLIVEGFGGHVIVESSLIDMYAKCGLVEDAHHVFDTMPRKNCVSWCALLSGYCHNGDFGSVIELFRMMYDKDLYSFGIVLRACAGMADVKLGKEVHGQYVRKGGKGYIIIESALVDLYAKTGCINYANRVFVGMQVKNLITWNTMICGFAQNGRGVESVTLYNKMIEEGMKPDYITFVGVLFGCSHAGLVDQGRQYFTSMMHEYGIKPGAEHYTCMVDLLGRAGLIEEAERLIGNPGCQNASSLWPALLGACATSRNDAAAERIARRMMERDPTDHLSYVHLTNMYKAVGRFEDASSIRKLMKHRGLEKTPGKSWVDITKGMVSPDIHSAYHKITL